MSFFISIVFWLNDLTLPSKWASRIRFNNTDYIYRIIFLRPQRVCHQMEMFDNSFSIYALGRPGISGAEAGAVIFISCQEPDREPFTKKFG